MSFGGVPPYQHNNEDKYIADPPQYHSAPPQSGGSNGGVHTYNIAPSHANNPFQPNPDGHDAPIHNAQPWDATDAEMLAEAQQHEQHNAPIPVSDEHEDSALEESLAWIPKTHNSQHAGSRGPLPVPVVIPQISPGMQASFSRAWAPILANHDVQPEDFLQFLDHLNVCKAASPPFQVLNLAGTVLGFTPIPFAGLIGMGTSVAAGAGSYAVARVRITRYLERANTEYFHPRGLLASIAKQNTLPQLIHQSENAPLLAPLPSNISMGSGAANMSSMPTLRDRRLLALGTNVAHIEFRDLPPGHEEGNMLDKLSAKMTTMKANRQEEKAVENSMKGRKKDEKEERKLDREMDKVMRKESGRKLEKEVRKIEEKRGELGGGPMGGGYGGGHGSKEGGKEEKAARKFMFVVVMDAGAAKAGIEVCKREREGNPALR